MTDNEIVGEQTRLPCGCLWSHESEAVARMMLTCPVIHALAITNRIGGE